MDRQDNVICCTQNFATVNGTIILRNDSTETTHKRGTNSTYGCMPIFFIMGFMVLCSGKNGTVNHETTMEAKEGQEAVGRIEAELQYRGNIPIKHLVIPPITPEAVAWRKRYL